MSRRSLVRTVILLAGIALAWIAGVALRRQVDAPRSVVPSTVVASDPGRADVSRAESGGPGSDARTGARATAASRPESSDPGEEDLLAGADNGWAVVDLEAARAAMPDNIYWEMSVPSRDPEVLRRREEERERWNVEYGKVLSNTATEEEIVAYYEHRDRLASDYVEFVTYILENYGESLTLRDVGLLKVAAELNLARLEEIPRQLEEALERRKAHEAAREAWLRDEAAFAGAASGDQTTR